MSENIPEGINRQHILAAISDLDSGVPHKFADSTGYDVLFEGRRYPPKAVIGLAAGNFLGRDFGPYDFKGGLKSKCFRILESNGFEVISKVRTSLETPAPDAWTKEELRASVSAYLDMQSKERAGERFVKKNYYKELTEKYGRSEKAFEYRMQNISYVMTLMGRSWLSGLKPAKNVGANVAAEIEDMIGQFEGRSIIPIAEFEIKARSETKSKQLHKPVGTLRPKPKQSAITQYERDPEVKAWVLREAKGICESCGQTAPFKNSDGQPFLEVHHVQQLADGGSDTVDNAVAICPNCHREAHYGEDSKALISRLLDRIARRTQR